jgi:hypothetical protein
MPAMVRIKGKPTKIAYKVLGTPSNIRQDKTSQSTKMKKQLEYEDAHNVQG